MQFARIEQVNGPTHEIVKLVYAPSETGTVPVLPPHFAIDLPIVDERVFGTFKVGEEIVFELHDGNRILAAPEAGKIVPFPHSPTPGGVRAA